MQVPIKTGFTVFRNLEYLQFPILPIYLNNPKVYIFYNYIGDLSSFLDCSSFYLHGPLFVESNVSRWCVATISLKLRLCILSI